MSGHTPKVLLVEDEAILLELACRAFKRAGFEKTQIDTATTGKDAYHKAKNEKYGVIIMDIGLPECNGITVTKKLRKEDGPNKETPIIAHTGDISARMRKEKLPDYLKDGFNDAIPKDPRGLPKILKEHGITPTENNWKECA